MTKLLHIWDYLRKYSKDRYAGSQNIHTPKDITAKVLDSVNIRKGEKVCVLNLELILECMERRINNKDITFSTDHGGKTQMANNLQVNHINHLNASKMFDVVLGNPPFNGQAGQNRLTSKNTNNSNLYFDFIKDSINSAKRVVGLITPASWMYKDDIKNIVVDSGLKKIQQIDPKCFPGVDIRGDISYMEIEIGYSGDIEIETLSAKYRVKRHSVLTFDNPHKYSIIEKILNGRTILSSCLTKGPYKVPKGVKGSLGRLLQLSSDYSQTKTVEYKIPVLIYAGGNTKQETMVYAKKDMTKKIWGVAIPDTSDKRKLGSARLLPPGTGVSEKLKVLYFASKTEAENFINYIESTLIKFVIKTTKHNDTVNTNKNSFSNIPMIDFKKSYTDSGYYKLFNLNSSEINIVKS